MDAKEFHDKMEEIKKDIQENKRDHYGHAEISEAVENSVRTARSIGIDYEQMLLRIKEAESSIRIYTKYLRGKHSLTNILLGTPFPTTCIGERNLVIVLEELSELQDVVIDFLSGNVDKEHIVEEVADVYIGLKYVEKICAIDNEDIKTAIDVKIDRLNNTIEKEGTFK